MVIKINKQMKMAWCLAPVLLCLTSCNTFVDLDEYDSSYLDNNTTVNNTNNFNNLNNINNVPGSCLVDSAWDGAMTRLFSPVIVSKPPAERGTLWFETELEVKNNGDVFVGYRHYERSSPVIVGTVQHLKVKSSGDGLDLMPQSLELPGAISGMPLDVEAIALGGGPTRPLNVGVIGGGCDPGQMAPTPGESLLWFGQWSPMQGQSPDPYAEIDVNYELCASWPPSNIMALPRPAMGRAAIVDDLNDPTLIFKIPGGNGPDMPQQAYWTRVSKTYSSPLEQLIPAQISNPDPLFQSQIIVADDGPLVMAESLSFGDWVIWNPYTGQSSELSLGSNRADITSFSPGVFVIASQSGPSEVALHLTECELQGGGFGGEVCLPLIFIGSVKADKPVIDVKVLALPDPRNPDPTLLIFTSEDDGGAQVIRARVVRVQAPVGPEGPDVCAVSAPLTMSAPGGIKGDVVDMRVGARVASGNPKCRDVIAATTQGDQMKPEQGPVSMVWAGGFRICQR